MRSNPTEDREKGIYFPMTCRGESNTPVVSCSVVSGSLRPHGLHELNPPGSSVHGILRTRILEWAAILFSRGSSPPRD